MASYAFGAQEVGPDLSRRKVDRANSSTLGAGIGRVAVTAAFIWSKRRDCAAYFSNRINFRPALVDSSFASSVPSLSEFAALKRCSTRARYSSLVRVPS